MTAAAQRQPFDRAQAEPFLQAIWCGLPGVFETRSGIEGLRSRFHTTVGEAVVASDLAVEQGLNAYAALASRREPGNGRKDNLGATRVLWCESDWKTEADALAHRAARARFPLAPSIEVQSSPHGVHLYWILVEPVDLTTPAPIERLEAVLRGLCSALGGDPSTFDATRILRVPGTVNVPNARKRKAGRVTTSCSLISLDKKRVYSLDDFANVERHGARLLRRNRLVPDYAAHPWAGDLPESVRERMSGSATLRLLLSKPFSELGYPSPSEADWSLATALLESGAGPGDAEHALRWRQAHLDRRPKSLDYFRRTVRNAQARVGGAHG